MPAIESRSVVRAILAPALLALAATTAQATSTTIANGVVQWTDREGNVHPANRTFAQLWEYDDVSASDFISQGYTSGVGGVLSMITNQEDGLFDSQLEVYADLWALSDIAGGVYDNAGSILRQYIPTPTTYWPITIGAGTGTTPVGSFGTTTLDNDTDLGRAIGVIQATTFMASYYKDNKGKTVPTINTFYHSGITGSSAGQGTFNLRYTAWDDWDVIFHEFGHHVAENNNLDYRDPGTGVATWADAHGAGFDNINGVGQGGYNYTAVKGSRIAWGEAVATTLGMFAIHDGNLNAAIPNLPAKDCDTSYRSNTAGGAGVTRVLDSQASLEYSLETPTNNSTRTVGMTVFNSTYRGEGDEWSISSTIHDFSDSTPGENYTTTFNANRSDRVNTTVDVLLDNMTGADTFQDFWQNMTVTADTAAFKTNALGLPAGASTHQARAILGEVLEEHRISAMPFTTGNVAAANPTLFFGENNNGNSNLFKVLIFDSNWTLFDQSADILDNDANRFTNNFSFTLNNALALGQSYWWVVLSNSALDANNSPGAGFDKWYWSGANPLTYVPAPGPVALLSLAAAAALRRRRPGPLRRH